MRTVSSSYGAAKARAYKHDKVAAVAAFYNAEQLWNENPALFAPLVLTARASLDAISVKEYEGADVRARLRWAEDGERPTRYFCRLERGRQQDSTITELSTPDGPATNPQAISREAGRFYYALFSEDDPISGEAQATLLDALDPARTLDALDREACDRPLTLVELRAVLSRCARNRSPGIDGILYEFYVALWDEIGPTLLRVLRASLEAGVLPPTCRTGRHQAALQEGRAQGPAQLAPPQHALHRLQDLGGVPGDALGWRGRSADPL